MVQQIKQAYAFIKKWFWALPMWKKTILTSLIGAFAGSSVIGFLNRYALYYHALKQGFRMPVEGVEYLDLAVSLVSFIVILLTFFGTLIIYFIVNSITKLTIKATRLNKRLFSLKSEYIIQFIVSVISILISNFVLQFIGNDNKIDIQNLSIVILFIIIFGLVASFKLRSSKKSIDNKLLTLAFVSYGVLLIFMSLFNQKTYSNFLATIHYGGRIPVVIEYREADNTAASATGELLIRTSHSVTILNTDTCAHEEIPAERVSKIGFIKE